MPAAGHALRSFELAVNWTQCGRFPYLLDTEPAVRDLVAKNADILDVPLSQLLAKVRGTKESYCAAANRPFVNNENSLTLLFAAVLWVGGDITLNQVGGAFYVLRLAALSVFVIAIFRLGLSAALSLLTFVVGANVIEQATAYTPYSLYPFLLPALLLYTVLLLAGLGALGTRRWLLAVIALICIGMFGAFYFNLRTSHLPIVLAGFGIWLIFVYRLLRRDLLPGSRRLIGVLLASIALFGVGFSAVHHGMAAPVARTMPTAERSYHVVAHPLVLALATPENPLAKREGIEWLDRVGLQLARRVDPAVTYLGPGYEEALWRYYWQLWTKYPGEMGRLYLEKWKLAGAGALAMIQEGRKGTRLLMQPLSFLNNGVGITAVFGFLFAWGMLWPRRRGHYLIACVVAFLAASCLLVEGEAAFIYSLFKPAYQHPLAFGLGLALILFYQAIMNYLGSLKGEASRASSDSGQTIRDFGTQWTTYSDTAGFFGSADLLADFIGPFPISNFRGAAVVDIGAGTGRHVRALLEAGAAKVVAVEPSESIRVIIERVAEQYPDKVVALNVRGDELPARADMDYVISIGVMHHIPDPVPVVRAAYGALKPGGKFIVWLYGKEGNELYLLLVTPLRWLTKHLPHKAVAGLAWLLDIPLAGYIRLCRAIPSLGWPLREYMTEILGKLPADKRRLVIYDQLKPHYARYYSRAAALALLQTAPFKVEIHRRRGYSWVVIGTKPHPEACSSA
ncbi:MAG: class I SAM-dependent methyltransferase [Chromatiales bacterium]